MDLRSAATGSEEDNDLRKRPKPKGQSRRWIDKELEYGERSRSEGDKFLEEEGPILTEEERFERREQKERDLGQFLRGESISGEELTFEPEYPPFDSDVGDLGRGAAGLLPKGHGLYRRHRGRRSWVRIDPERALEELSRYYENPEEELLVEQNKFNTPEAEYWVARPFDAARVK